jgi:transmembrane sensor
VRLEARQIDSNAIDWAVKLDRGLTEAEQQDLEIWLGQDSRCLGALARAQAGWVHTDRAQALKGIHQLRSGRLLPGVTVPRHWAAAAVVLLSMLGAKWWWDFSANHPSTAVGEIRRVPLADGSQVTLDTGSGVAVHYKAQTRLVTLERGVALFDVAKDPKRPFIVEAGQTRVRAVGTSFIVRRWDKGEEVIVVHGTVDVWRELASPESSTRLTAQHRTLSSGGQFSSPELMSLPEMDRATAWKSGAIALSGQSIAEASEEFNRYNRLHIVVDPVLAGETVVGRFRSSDPTAFAQAAAAMLKARVRADGDTLVLEPLKP